MWYIYRVPSRCTAEERKELKKWQDGTRKEVNDMGYGSVSYEPFTSMQAHLKIAEVEEVDGAFEDTPRQVKCEFEVLGYEESEDDGEEWVGWTFTDWFGFSVDKKTGDVGISKSAKAKLPNIIQAALHPDGQKVIDSGTFEPEMLKGKEVRARAVRSGKNEDGDHSRIKAESLMPKPRGSKLVPVAVAAEAEEDADFKDLPF